MNGVVRTLTTVANELRAMGHVVDVIGPNRFRTIACPTYPDIRLSLFPGKKLAAMIEEFRPDALHISTEGPLGLAARAWARRNGASFTTAFHTRFAEYIQARTGLPVGPIYAWMRRFHGAGKGIMVATRSLSQDLERRGFQNIRPWTRGVDLSLFRPEPAEDWDLPRPIFAYVGRVAVEKNIEAFLDLDLPGSKVVVGGGPALAGLQQRYPNVRFTGPRLCRGGCVRVPIADRHVRPGDPGGAGLRHPRRRLPRHRPDGHSDRRRGSRRRRESRPAHRRARSASG